MKILITDIDWDCDEHGHTHDLPSEITTAGVDCDNSEDDIREILSDWLDYRFGPQHGFAWRILPDEARTDDVF